MIIAARVRCTTEGYAFSGVRLLTLGGGDPSHWSQVPSAGRGYPQQRQGYLSQPGQGYHPARRTIAAKPRAVSRLRSRRTFLL